MQRRNDHNDPSSYTVGEIVHYSICADSYPAVVTKVTAKSVTVAPIPSYGWRVNKNVPVPEVGFHFADHRFDHSEVLVDVSTADHSRLETYRVTKYGLTHRKHTHLGHGFSYHIDPHV